MPEPSKSVFLVQLKSNRLALRSKGGLVLRHHSYLRIIFNSADNQNTSCRSLKVNRAESTIGRFISCAFVHMTDQQNSAVIFFRHSSKLCHHAARFVSVVHIDISADICLNRIKDYHSCTDFYNCFFNSFIQHTECSFRFVYDFDLRAIRFCRL